MNESKSATRQSKIVMLVVALAVFVADQVSKTMVAHRIADGTVVPVIPGFFNLTSTRNSGAVFGFFSDTTVWWKTPALVALSIALLAGVVYLLSRVPNLAWPTRRGLALILGGALSNLLDRVRWGQVEDFLDFYFRHYHWYTFNLADSAIVVGTGFVVLQILRES